MSTNALDVQGTSTRNAYFPPQFDDARSPCPALNALANHSYIPHSGKNISSWQLCNSINKVYGLSWWYSALLTFPATFWLSSGLTCSLNDLRKHNGIEHDGSLTRADVAEPTDKFAPTAPDQTKLNQILGDATELSLDDLVAIRVARNEELLRSGRTLKGFHNRFANGEVAFTFLTWANPDGKMPVSKLRMWFGEDRLPDELPSATRFHSVAHIRKTVDVVTQKVAAAKKTQ
ncbi:heme-thiolate peroxidase [Auriculariales sp. MPI-PUGE-AT-0066]|nr:heme-thiolate peroxidase [Auriculariales sp. MPI-PUGE-AT-0066]